MDQPIAAVETDLPCVVCGYNLKGLTSDANCPECGQAIARTFHPDLRFSSPQWLRGQAVTVFILVAVGLLGPGSEGFVAPISLPLLYNALVLIATLIGVFRLSAPDASILKTGAASDPWHRSIRAAAVTLAAINLLSVLPIRLDSRLVQLLILTSVISLVGLQWLVVLFLYWQAKRSADRALIAHAWIVLWALPLQYVAHIIFGLYARVATGPDVYYYAIPILNWMTSLVFPIYVLLLGRMHEMFRSAAKAVESASP